MAGTPAMRWPRTLTCRTARRARRGMGRPGSCGRCRSWSLPTASPIASRPNRPVHWAKVRHVAPPARRPPNIVLIVADDLGINDITAEGPGTGVAGGLVPTPNIDAIAQQGADFTVAYAANATCSPSRAALMTGRYPPRFGFEFTAVPDQLAKYVPRYSPQNRPHPTIYHAELQGHAPPMADMGMPASEVTIAEVLKAPRLSHDPSWQMAPWRIEGHAAGRSGLRRKPRLHAGREQI